MMTESSAPMRRRAADDNRLRRDIGMIGLLFTAVGSIIGSGWLFGALGAAQTAGPGAVVAWAIGGVMIMLIGLCYAELGTMFPVSGGVIRFPHYAFGSLPAIRWAGSPGWQWPRPRRSRCWRHCSIRPITYPGCSGCRTECRC
jgi:L-asparagine transporter-like permease